MNSLRESLRISPACDPESYLLSRVLDHDYMKHEFQKVLTTTWDGARVDSVRTAELVRRKPARRSLIKYNVVLRRNSEKRLVLLYGKVRIRSMDWRTFRLTTELWNTSFGPDSGHGAYVPEPVGAVPRLNMWLQRRIAARPLTMTLDSPNGLQHCADTGYALGKLHSQGPKTDRRHDLSDELASLSQGLLGTCEEMPRYAKRIRKVLDACYELAEMMPDSVPVGIHRDFYPDQVLCKLPSTWLIDFDLYARGDRAVDLGNFVAHLQELSLRRYGDNQRYCMHEKAFLDAYANSTGCGNCHFAAAAYATLSIARLVAISRRISARRNCTGKLLRLCEERLGIPDKKSCKKPKKNAVRFLQDNLA